MISKIIIAAAFIVGTSVIVLSGFIIDHDMLNSGLLLNLTGFAGLILYKIDGGK